MSSSDPPPPSPPPQQPPTMPAGNVGNFWPQNHMDREHSGPQAQIDHSPPFKRQRNHDNQLNAAPFPPMNPRTNQPNPLLRGNNHIFYKTRICIRFADGYCPNGERCNFAHGLNDLREPGPNWQEHIRANGKGTGGWNHELGTINRTKICGRFYNGEECPYGEKCNFLHESPSRFKTDMAMPLPKESSSVSIGTSGPMMEYRIDTHQTQLNKHLNPSSDAIQVEINPAYLKTKMCRRWEITGQCPYGERCYLAHGQSELGFPGNRDEGEAMMNRGSVLAKSVLLPANDVAFDNSVAGARIDKKFPNWKPPRKIIGIYGDWLDDHIPPEELP